MKKIFFSFMALFSISAFAQISNIADSAMPPTNNKEVKSNESVQNTTNSNELKNISIKPKANTTLEEIKKNSSQSMAEFIKRRNETFQTEMTKCIDAIPKNAKGERSSEAVVKCAELERANNTK